jgi:hypothetical protein
MAIDVSKLETLYLAKINGAFAEDTIEREEATILLANYLSALKFENSQSGSVLQSWTIAGKQFTARDIKSLHPPAHYRASLLSMLGEYQSGAFVSMGGRVTVDIANR